MQRGRTRSFHMHFKRRKFFLLCCSSVRHCIGFYAFVMTIKWMNSCSWTTNLCPHITDNYCYCYSFVLFHLTYVLLGVSYFMFISFRFPSFKSVLRAIVLCRMNRLASSISSRIPISRMRQSNESYLFWRAIVKIKMSLLSGRRARSSCLIIKWPAKSHWIPWVSI